MGGIVVFLVKNKDNKKESKKDNKDFNSKVTEEQISMEEQASESGEQASESGEQASESEEQVPKVEAPVVSEAHLKKLEELREDAKALNGVDGWDVILGTLDGILISNEGSEEVISIADEIFDEFYGNSLDYIAMIEGIEAFSSDTYRECIIRYEEIERWNETLGLDYDESIGSKKEECKQKHKEKFVDRFDAKCVETMQQNGVVSRTVAWDALQGIENTDLYDPSGDRYDPLRLRYIASKVLKINKDIEAGMYLEDAYNMINGAMVECDYDPMLIYLLYINEYEPAQTWMKEVENIIDRYANQPSYSGMFDNDRMNFVYLYNTSPDKYKECREAIIEYMEKNY